MSLGYSDEIQHTAQHSSYKGWAWASLNKKQLVFKGQSIGILSIEQVPGELSSSNAISITFQEVAVEL